MELQQAVVSCDLKGMARGTTLQDMALNTVDMGRNYILATAGNKLLVSFAPVGGKRDYKCNNKVNNWGKEGGGFLSGGTLAIKLSFERGLSVAYINLIATPS